MDLGVCVASHIGDINAIAPGRTFFGVGAGNTAMRVIGLPPQRIKEFDRYLQTVGPLLKGEEGQLPLPGRAAGESPIVHIMPDKGFVNFVDAIPMYVSGFGPKSLALAGQHGDGAVLALAASPAAMQSIWHYIEEGAREVGRAIDRESFYTTALAAMVVLDDGEAVDSPRVKSECGAMAMAAVHYTYDQWRNFGHQPPNHLAEIWEDYTAMLEAVPQERRHQRIHAGHNCWVLPEEEKFLTPKVLTSTCLIGTRDTLVEQLAGLAAAGLHQVMLLPNFDTRYENIERVARDVLPAVAEL